VIIRTLVTIGALLFCAQSVGQTSFPQTELSFQPNNSGFAVRSGNSRDVYSLLGIGQIKGLRSKNFDALVARWLAAHPKAIVKDVCSVRMNLKHDGEMVFIWIADGDENLNVYLVSEGAVPAALMHDFVEVDESISAEHRQELAKIPNGLGPPPKRLIPAGAYSAFTRRVDAVGEQAQATKKGIWSSEYDSLRDE
jgi:hypothetical protein